MCKRLGPRPLLSTEGTPQIEGRHVSIYSLLSALPLVLRCEGSIGALPLVLRGDVAPLLLAALIAASVGGAPFGGTLCTDVSGSFGGACIASPAAAAGWVGKAGALTRGGVVLRGSGPLST